jgi:hypothetical protein
MLTLRDAPHSPSATILYLMLVIAGSRAIWSCATPITSAPAGAPRAFTCRTMSRKSAMLQQGDRSE